MFAHLCTGPDPTILADVQNLRNFFDSERMHTRQQMQQLHDMMVGMKVRERVLQRQACSSLAMRVVCPPFVVCRARDVATHAGRTHDPDPN